jgi:hypothetical protein
MLRLVYIVTILVFLAPWLGFAHAPAKVNLEFEKKTQFIRITYEHKVKDAGDHFVYLVKVRLNKKDLIEQNLGRQDDENGGLLIYKINEAKIGDTVEVRLYCNKAGNKTGKLIIE